MQNKEGIKNSQLNIGIIGLGLIGGSLAKAISNLGVHVVRGFDTNQDVLNAAQSDGSICGKLTKDCISECDILFVALTPHNALDFLNKNAEKLNNLVVDCCGVKRLVFDAYKNASQFYDFLYIGGHPMAGREVGGYSNALDDLYKGASMILVTDDKESIYNATYKPYFEQLSNLLCDIGFENIEISTPDEHDQIIAFTSQLAHVVSNAYVKSPTLKHWEGFSAGSLLDLTRVAYLDERMWTELFFANADNLEFEIDTLISELTKYKEALSSQNNKQMTALLRDGKRLKSSMVPSTFCDPKKRFDGSFEIPVLVDDSYKVTVGYTILSSLPKVIPANQRSKIVLITDENVDALYGAQTQRILKSAGYTCLKIVVSPGEASKSLIVYESILHKVTAAHIDRNDVVVALGGGVVGDLAGFVASTYKRGIRYVQVPTTLLAAVDSSVGGKCAINLSEGKNLVGSFYQPSAVLCDCNLLNSLPHTNFSEGMGEIIKYAVLMGEPLLGDLVSILNSAGASVCSIEDIDPKMVTKIVTSCISYKATIVSKDERDTGIRQILNLGHTFGHALETLSHHSISHGHAVGTGLALISKMSVDAGYMEPSTFNTIKKLLLGFNLKVDTKFSAHELYDALLSDKKIKSDCITLVVPKSFGDVCLLPISLTSLQNQMVQSFDCSNAV